MGNNPAAKPAASYLYNLFNSDKILPSQSVSDFLKLLPGIEKGFAEELLAEWSHIAGNINSPVILTRGAVKNCDEENLSSFFPEEKLLINRSVFRRKLSDLDFTELNSRRERRIIDELRNEAIGLTDQEVLIYYNLLKNDMLSRSISVNNGAANHLPEIIVSSNYAIIGQGSFDYTDKIVSLLEADFSSLDMIAAVNGNKMPGRPEVIKALNSKLKKAAHNPRVISLLSGFEIDKYAIFIRKFLKRAASVYGKGNNEILSYYAAYLLLNSARSEFIDELQLSESLENFISDRPGKLSPRLTGFYCAVIFISVFTYTLVMQIMEISRKYFSSPELQKDKLAKLYDSEERISMLVNNACNTAAERIGSFRTESGQILSVFNKQMKKNKNIISADDIFKTRYNF